MLGTILNWWAWVETVLVVILGTPVVALVFACTAPFDKGRYAAGRAFRLVGVTAMRLNGLWSFRVRGSLADPRRPYVVIANHESYADVFLLSCFPWEMKWLSKDTMFKIPCMGWMMRMAGDIHLVRGDRDSTINAIAQCRDRLAKKVSVMVFPEGTRSKTQEMLPFDPIETAHMTLSDLPTLKAMARERIDMGRRALAAELGIAMPPVGATASV